MQAVRPAPPRHQASGELVNDQNFAVFHNIVNIAAVDRVRFDSSLDVMLERPVFRIGDVADAEQLLHLLPTFIGDSDSTVLLIDRVVACEDDPLGIVANFGEFCR